MRTHYEVLGVDRQATMADIAQRYRHHLNQHMAASRDSQDSARRQKDQRRMQRMREAYLLLSSPSRRRAYDLYLDQRERAQRSLVARSGMACCVVMLIAGALLMGRGILRMQVNGMPVVPQVVQMEEAANEWFSSLLLSVARHATEASRASVRD